MGAYNPPAPAVTPVQNGITFIAIGGKAILAAKFTDGTKKLLLYDSKIVRGTIYPEDDNIADIPITASPGIQEQQPATVPLRFNDTTSEIPAGYETANLEAVFVSYSYDQDEALANWEAKLVVENVRVEESNIENGYNGFLVQNF